MKKYLWISIHVAILLVFVVAGLLVGSMGRFSNKNIDKSSEPGLYPLTSISEFVALENAVVYVGKESCKECRMYEPVLKEIIAEEQLKIYYFDTNYFRAQTDTAEDELQKIFDEYQIIGVPMLLELKNGQLEAAMQMGGFDQNAVSKVKNATKDFLSLDIKDNRDVGFIIQHSPHDTVIMILFALSAISLILQITFRKKVGSNRTLFTNIFVNIGFITLMVITVKSAMNYLDLFGLSGNAISGVLAIASILINLICVLCATLFMNRSRVAHAAVLK